MHGKIVDDLGGYTQTEKFILKNRLGIMVPGLCLCINNSKTDALLTLIGCYFWLMSLWGFFD